MSTPQQKLELAKRHAPRFDDALQARMKEIGLTTFEAVADSAGITVTTLSALRKGQNYPSAKSAWGLDTTMRWHKNPSSTVALFNGGNAVALPEEPEMPAEDPFEVRVRRLSNLSREKQDQIIAKMHADRDAELERAEALDKLAQLEGSKKPNGDKGRRSA